MNFCNWLEINDKFISLYKQVCEINKGGGSDVNFFEQEVAARLSGCMSKLQVTTVISKDDLRTFCAINTLLLLAIITLSDKYSSQKSQFHKI